MIKSAMMLRLEMQKLLKEHNQTIREKDAGSQKEVK